MIQVNVKTPWKGMIAIRDKYIKEAKRRKEDISINCNNNSLIIPFNDIDKEILMKSSHMFKDNFSNESHYLIYFKWNQISEGQKKLL